MEIIWSSLAIDNWEVAARYIANEFGKSVLQNFLTDSLSWQQQLIANPHIGHVEPLLKKRVRTYYSLVVNKRNKVIYYLEEDKIYIADFWDTRREPKSQIIEIKD